MIRYYHTARLMLPILLLNLNLLLNLQAQVLVDWQSEWEYYKGRNEPSSGTGAWREATFDASGWSTGLAPFRYGDGAGGTLLSDMQNAYPTVYLRKSFDVESGVSFDELRLTIDYDDGFAVWINGELLHQAYAPQDLTYDQFATANHESGEYEVYTFPANSIQLLQGVNTIAVQGFNVSLSSSDFFLDLKLEGVIKLPETDPAQVDVNSGFFTDAFTVSLTAASTGDMLKYTLDGSDPRYSSTAITTYAPASVRIDPSSTEGGRGLTGGVILRASKFADGYEPSRPVTRSYLFLQQIIGQHTHPGGRWPASNINSQWIDLAMDARITNHTNYREMLEDALLDIPTISLVTDPDHLFHPQTGIYVNAKYHGRAWERPANIELIHPDGSRGFNEDAGIRIRGGWSRHPEFPKHAFRIFFRSEYGVGRLNFPLFGDEGTGSFDKIDLRTSQNYSWSKGGSEGVHNTMNRDVFSRDTQRDIGQPYTRSRYYHLYINGLYWGIFQSQERAEANFAESYLGGDQEDYDVIKVDIGENWNLYDIEATDGNTEAWEAIWQMCQKGFASNEDYFHLIGYDAAGEPDLNKNVWVDVDNLIDYMLIIFYGGNFDAPVSKFRGNQDPNNFFAVYDRVNTRRGFKFFIHDSEHTLLTDAVGPGIGLQENRVNIARSGMQVSRFEKFHPQWLHYRLSQNEEYRMRFTDRVYRHFFNGGVFDPDSCIARFKQTSDQLYLAIVAESARWGDVGMSSPRTRNTDWIPAVNRVVNNYMPFRSDIVLNQLRAENLYPQIQPPVVSQGGEVVTLHRMSVSAPQQFILTNPNSGGTVYYTSDGTDPRKPGGDVSATARVATVQQAVDIAVAGVLKARVLSGGAWSALREIVFTDASIFQHLKITELHYNPPDIEGVPGTELEFLELKNTGNTVLDLSGLRFSEGISGEFPPGSTLNPGAFFVAVSNTEAFFNYYGLQPSMEYSGQLSNSGEEIILVTSDEEVVLAFTYSDKAPWPAEADGDGYSLVSAEINPKGDPNNYMYWTLSANMGGSPFADDGKSSYFVGFQQLIEGAGATIIDLDEVFDGYPTGTLQFAATNSHPDAVSTTIQDHYLRIEPIKRGDAKISLTASHESGDLIETSFRVLVYPAPHLASAGDFVFDSWDAGQGDYAYPQHMLFLQTETDDPELMQPLLFPYMVPYNDYHSNDLALLGFPYALTARTRINALGDDGIAFINTGRQRDLGGALLALDTRAVSRLQVSWTAGTLLKNQRRYAIRLQYRKGLDEEFRNLTKNGQVQEYIVQDDGHTFSFDAVELPPEIMGEGYVQLLWRYYHIPGATGPRAQLRLDDIHIGSKVGIDRQDLQEIILYAYGQRILVDFGDMDAGRARLRVFNLMGQEVYNDLTLSGHGMMTTPALPAGLYIVCLEHASGVLSRKVVLGR